MPLPAPVTTAIFPGVSIILSVSAKFTNERSEHYLAPVRVPGGTRQATRVELEALFAEEQDGRGPDIGWNLNAPEMPRGSDGGEDPTVDLVVLSGLRSRVSAGAWGRPISQRVIEGRRLIAALNGSPLASFLDSLLEFERDTIYFHHEGLNRSSVANLVWRELGDPNPFEIRAHIEVPGQYGQMHVGSLAFTITVTSRLTAFLGAACPPTAMARAGEGSTSRNGEPCFIPSPALSWTMK